MILNVQGLLLSCLLLYYPKEGNFSAFVSSPSQANELVRTLRETAVKNWCWHLQTILLPMTAAQGSISLISPEELLEKTEVASFTSD